MESELAACHLSRVGVFISKGQVDTVVIRGRCSTGLRVAKYQKIDWDIFRARDDFLQRDLPDVGKDASRLDGKLTYRD